MNHLYTGILSFLLVFNSIAQTSKFASGEILCNNFIEIKGKTNINEFHLQQIVPESEICAKDQSGWLSFPESSIYQIKIPIRNFDANNHFVYRDFLSLLNASDYPYIQIKIDENQFRKLFNHESIYSLNIYISLAGNTRLYRVNCKIIECDYGGKVITGNKQIKLTDFKLDPPVKSLGLIKVKNELNINFEFNIPDQLNAKLTEN